VSWRGHHRWPQRIVSSAIHTIAWYTSKQKKNLRYKVNAGGNHRKNYQDVSANNSRNRWRNGSSEYGISTVAWGIFDWSVIVASSILWISSHILWNNWCLVSNANCTIKLLSSLQGKVRMLGWKSWIDRYMCLMALLSSLSNLRFSFAYNIQSNITPWLYYRILQFTTDNVMCGPIDSFFWI